MKSPVRLQRKVVLRVAAVVLVVGVAVALVWLRMVSNRQLAVLRAAGLPTTLEELQALCAPPEGENAADVYSEAFHLLEFGDHSDEKPLPFLGSDLDRSELGQRLSEDMLAACKAFLAKQQEAIAVLHRASAMPECRFTPAGALTSPLPHLAPLRHSQRVLCLDALTAASEGRSEDAVAAVVATTGLVHSLDREPVLISQLVRFACLGLSEGALVSSVNLTSFDDAQLKRLSDAYSGMELRKPLGLGLAGERCLAQAGFQNSTPPLVGVVTRVWEVPGYKRVLLDCMNVLVSESMGDVRRHAFEERPVALSAVRPLTSSMTSTCSDLLRAYLREEAFARTRVAALAVQRFRLKEGRLPDTLDALVPAYLPAVPQDPYDDQPLRYTKRDGGFVVYSVGENGQDDGGTSPSNGRNAFEQGDLTFTVLH